MLTGRKLKAIRAVRGITQAALAEAAGCSPTNIATFETGKSDMRLSTVNKLCAVLGVQIVLKVGDVEIR